MSRPTHPTRGACSHPTSCGSTRPLSLGAPGFSARRARRGVGLALNGQLLVSAPGFFPGAPHLPRLLDHGVDDLALPRGEGMPCHFPHALLVAEAITNLEQHRQDLEGFGSHARGSSIDAPVILPPVSVGMPPAPARSSPDSSEWARDAQRSSELGLGMPARPAPTPRVQNPRRY